MRAFTTVLAVSLFLLPGCGDLGGSTKEDITPDATEPLGLVDPEAPVDCEPISAEQVENALHNVSLPSPRADAVTAYMPNACSAACPAGCIFVLGGRDGDQPSLHLYDIVRVEPTSGRVETLAAKLPNPRGLAGGAEVGGRIYVVGGSVFPPDETGLNDFVQSDEDEVFLEDMAWVLPGHPTPGKMENVMTGTTRPAVASDGKDLYSFGGYPRTGEIRQINPSTGTTHKNLVNLPTALFGSTAVWSALDSPTTGCPGGCFYVFGGIANSNPSDDIVKFNPQTGIVAPVLAKLPTARHLAAGTSGGGNIYVVGGVANEGYLSQVVKFDPVKETVSTLAEGLETPVAAAGVAFLDGQLVVLGGKLSAGAFTDSIQLVAAN